MLHQARSLSGLRAPWRAGLAVGLVLVLGGALAVLALGPATPVGVTVNDVVQDTVAWLAVAAALGARRALAAAAPVVLGRVVIVLGIAATGLAIQDVAGVAGSTVAHALFLVAIVGFMWTISVEISRGVRGEMLAGAWLDALLIFVAGTVAAGVTWDRLENRPADPLVLLTTQGLLVLGAWSAAAALVLVMGRIRPSANGPWAALAGGLAVGTGAAAWEITATGAGLDRSVIALDPLIPLGLLAAAYGAATWDERRPAARRMSEVAAALPDLIPLVAVLMVIALEVTAPATGELAFVRLGLVAIIAMAGIRYLLVRVTVRRAERLVATHARRAATAIERADAATRRLVADAEDREAALRSMARLEAGQTVRETAQRICIEAVALDDVDVAWLALVDDDGVARVIASAGLPEPVLDGRTVTPTPGAIAVETGSVTVWLDRPAPAPELALNGVRATLSAPFGWEERVVGHLGLGTCSERTTAALARRAPLARELAVVAAALMRPGIAVDRRGRQARARVDDLIAGRGFAPVFQPIAEVATRRVVGYEALTRFADGRRPDEVFAAARAAGRGPELEVATLRAAVAAAAPLDPSRYVSLNLSPELASSPELLGPVLRAVDRDVVLEITEHVPVTDYERLIATLYALDLRVRLAVDDAGAGYAGLQHILAIRPHLIKLDTSLVRNVDTDLARQALIEGMVSFAGRIRATLVAEGVETEAEAAAVQALGVQLVQGYLLGHPAPAADLAGTRREVAEVAEV